LRRFAADDLGLAVGGSYATLTRVDAAQIIYAVSAAPRDRLVPYTWWFPIVGRMPYRGYFERADAAALAAELERDGYDTLVRPAVAFSTLGWFDDPLLSSLLRADDAQLAETVVHELTHNTLYVPGHADFNESFATFVGLHGAAAFFTARGDPDQAALAEQRWRDAQQFSRFLAAAVERLNAAYAAGIEPGARQALFEDLQARYRALPWATDTYAAFARAPLNNAVILHERLYADRFDVFTAVFRAHHGDLRGAIAAVVASAHHADDPYAALQQANPP
ncbi:MAG: aminopeptidase, partial [Candidatus Binatia bacterium]